MSKFVLIMSIICVMGLASSCTQVVTFPVKAVLDLGSDTVRVESTSVHNLQSLNQDRAGE